jgi:hypothetical protein
MFWAIGVATTYLCIGLLLAWGLSAAGGEKFKFTKQSVPFILTWPKLIFVMIFTDWSH